MKKIPLTQGKFALVDDEDFVFLNRLNWSLSVHEKRGLLQERAVLGRKIKQDNRPDIRFTLDMGELLVKRHSHKEETHYELWHINKNGLDYRKENLKYVPLTLINHLSRKRSNTVSKYRGVWLDKRSYRWVAQIHKDKKSYHLGHFSTEAEAAQVYNEKALELYGDLAYQNDLSDAYKIRLCKQCLSMTNHLGDKCQRCLRINKEK